MTEQLLDKSVRQFLDELASGAPTPGGGSVAALSAALAAGLLTMVCDLTIGKKQYAAFEAEATKVGRPEVELPMVALKPTVWLLKFA